MSKPTLIIVPGAWHTPFHFTSVTSFFESKGYPTICKQNLTCGATDPKLNNNDDAAAIRKSIDGVDGDVVIFMHSYGGVPGAIAATGAKNVIGLIFVSSFVLPTGAALDGDPKQDNNWAKYDVAKGTVSNVLPREMFYHDVDEETVQQAIKHLLPQNTASFSTPSNETSWPHLPKIYGLCTDDRILPLLVQETMVEKAGNWLEVKRFDTSHSPWLSNKAEFNTWLLSAVDKFVEHKGKGSDQP